MRRYYLFAIVAFIALVLVDQYTKYLIIANVPLSFSIPVLPFFNITYIRNYGAIFGFLNDSQINWQFWLFMGSIIIAMVFIFFLIRTNPKSIYTWVASICILSGGVGNTIDRVQYKYVVDFFDFYVGAYHWPAFNLADCYIIAGIIMLLLEPYVIKKQEGARCH